MITKAPPPATEVHDLKQRIHSLTMAARQAEASIAELKTNARRYMHVRRLNVRQFSDLYVANLNGKGPFDALVDREITKARS
jgi:hypothetical protein